MGGGECKYHQEVALLLTYSILVCLFYNREANQQMSLIYFFIEKDIISEIYSYRVAFNKFLIEKGDDP